jgi:hypothetical protein
MIQREWPYPLFRDSFIIHRCMSFYNRVVLDLLFTYQGVRIWNDLT